MNKLIQNLYITYSNQKVRDLKRNILKPLNKAVTLHDLVQELNEKHSFKKSLDPTVAKIILFQLIKQQNITYFDFIKLGSQTFDLIYDFILKVDASKIDFDDILDGEKLEAISRLNALYKEYKIANNYFDKNDEIKFAIENFDKYDFDKYSKVYVDEFVIDNIKFYKSQLEQDLLNLINVKANKIPLTASTVKTAQLHKLLKQPFDINDEVQSALKLSRKLLEEDENLTSNDICIITTDINEYAPIFRLYLDKFDLKGYDSKGKCLNLFDLKNCNDAKIVEAYKNVDSKVRFLKKEFENIGYKVDLNEIKNQLIKETYILEEKTGIELTEANQFVGLNKSYEHIIFIGTDINHFPPKRSDNFLFTSEIAQQYFCENNYYENSQLQYKELKRIANNLYVIYPQYKDKRQLSSSIIINDDIASKIDISNVIEKQNKIVQEYFIESINSKDFTKYDGLDVQDVNAKNLSASQLGSYAKCPLKYLYISKLRINKPTQDEEGFDVAQMGTLMHSCFESFAKKVQGNMDLNIDAFKSIMSEVLEDEYIKYIELLKEEALKDDKVLTENILHKIYKYTLSKGLKDHQEGLLSKFVNYYDKNKEKLEYFSNSEFEKEFALDENLNPYILKNKDDREYFIKGYIDRFDNLKDKVNIVDYKSKKADGVLKEKLEEIKDFKDFQLGLYSLYATQEYQKEIDAYLLTFKSKNPYSQFARISTNEDNVKEKNKKIGVLYDPEYEQNLKSNIYSIKEKIEQGDFRFDSSDEDYCGYCEIKNMCNYKNLDKGNINEL